MALKAVTETNADCVVSLGGGSTTGLGKAIAYRTGLPHIVIPTTYAGSEVTPILGQTEAGRKRTVKDPKILPQVVIYDPSLTTGLPVGLSMSSGLNAMAHAVEALYAQDRNPISTLMATEGLRAFRFGLPAVIADPSDLTARANALYGAWLCGTVLGTVGMALHHKICHTLGVRSTRRTRKHTRLCYRTPRHSTPSLYQNSFSLWPRSLATRLVVVFGTSQNQSVPHWLFAILG